MGGRQFFQVVRPSTTSTRGTSKRGQSVPVDLSKRTSPEEKGLPWRDLGELDTSMDYLYPDDTVVPCPVEKAEQLPQSSSPHISSGLSIPSILITGLTRIHESTVPTAT